MLVALCLSLTACDGGLNGDRALQRGMTEQEVTQLEGKQVPDRIICGPVALPHRTRFLARCTFTGEGCGWAGSARRLPSFSRMSEGSES